MLPLLEERNLFRKEVRTVETEAEEVLFTRLQIEISILFSINAKPENSLLKTEKTVAAVTATAKVRLILN